MKLLLMRSIGVLSLMLVLLSSCIQDDFVSDFVQPEVRITALLDTLGVGESFQFEAMFNNNIGETEDVEIEWSSSNTDVATVNNTGEVTAISEGSSSIEARYTLDSELLFDVFPLIVGAETVVGDTKLGGQIVTTSTYELTGDFTFEQDGDDVLLTFADNYRASRSLPGLYVYLTNNAATTNNALEIGKVEVFEGAHSYRIPNTALLDFSHVLYFCKPFNVKVGDGQIQ